MIQTKPRPDTATATNTGSAPLSPADLDRLDTYCFKTPCDINAAAAAHGISAAEFFLFLEQPHIADFVRRARATRAVHNFEVAAGFTRDLILQPGDAIERRRAAASLLRACNPASPRAAQEPAPRSPSDLSANRSRGSARRSSLRPSASAATTTTATTAAPTSAAPTSAAPTSAARSAMRQAHHESAMPQSSRPAADRGQPNPNSTQAPGPRSNTLETPTQAGPVAPHDGEPPPTSTAAAAPTPPGSTNSPVAVADPRPEPASPASSHADPRAAPQAPPPADPTPRQLAESLAHALHAEGSGLLAKLIDGLRTSAFTFKDSAAERRPASPISTIDIPQIIRDVCFDERMATTIELRGESTDHAIYRIIGDNGRVAAVMNVHFRRVRGDPRDPASARWRLDALEIP